MGDQLPASRPLLFGRREHGQGPIPPRPASEYLTDTAMIAQGRQLTTIAAIPGDHQRQFCCFWASKPILVPEETPEEPPEEPPQQRVRERQLYLAIDTHPHDPGYAVVVMTDQAWSGILTLKPNLEAVVMVMSDILCDWTTLRAEGQPVVIGPSAVQLRACYQQQLLA